MDFWLPPVKACTKPNGRMGDIAAHNLSSRSISGLILLVWVSPFMSVYVTTSGTCPIANPLAIACFGGVECSSFFDEDKLV
jgi:hypothetical protein